MEDVEFLRKDGPKAAEAICSAIENLGISRRDLEFVAPSPPSPPVLTGPEGGRCRQRYAAISRFGGVTTDAGAMSGFCTAGRRSFIVENNATSSAAA